ncbi:peptidoglycan-binding protein [Oceanobacillus sp. FSL W7-1293]|uniref:peptidoglycan-binding protein n=1 Tax=Oceanobacillus sp. FSL W7-1293 TaxID=2921699 RepID=UPI0030CFA2CC
MRRKWFPFFLVILLVTSPFASVSEVYAMSHSSKEDEQNNEPEERDKESDVDEQDSSTDEAVSEEIKLKLGDDDEKILDLKEDLTELGFAALEKPTTYYGLHTEEAVKAFQEFYDIEDTGVADEDTLLQIEYILADDSFDREEHLEFSKPEEFVTEEEEVEELPAADAEEDAEAEAEESPEEATEEETEADAEENAEEATEEETEADAEENAGEATEEESEADTEENAGEATEEESEADTEENAGEATEKESEADTEENAEEATEEETEADTEENTEEATEEESGADAEENAELEEEQEISIQSFVRATVFSANGTFKQGDRHQEIVKLKKRLNAIGFGNITETTLYGSFMETQVRRFQSYYGLTVNGQMNQATKNKLNSVYNSPLQRGKRHSSIPEIKRQLNSLGYGNISVTTLYGSFMEKKIKEFQKDHGLRVSGIADEVTVAKLKELAPKDTYQRGDRHAEIVQYKKQLNAIGFGNITETSLYGSFMETQVKRFQSYYGLSATGKMNKATKEKLNSVYNHPLQRGKRHSSIPEIKRQLNSLGYGNISVTTLYGSFMEKKIKEFQKDHGLRVSGIADEVTVAKLKELAPKDTYQRGDRHAEIVQYKKQLNAIGFGNITETSLYGSFMETQVKRFQSYYGLSATGKMNKATKEKLNSVYNHPLQRGKRHSSIPEIKRQLNSLGYGNISVTTLYGSFMEKKIKEFQKDHGLRVSGIADEVTVAKLKELAPKDTYQRGDRHAEIVQYKKQLNAIGFGNITETSLYGSFMETQVKRFQSYYGLSATGKMNKATKEKLNSVYNHPLQRGKRHSSIPEIKRQLNSLGYGNISVTTLYGSFMEKKIKEFQKDHGLRVSGIADEVTVAKLKELAPKDTYQRGDRHAEIVQYKKQLNAIGFGNITETSLYGSFMETQVKRFQSYYGLSATGKMNKATKEKLNSVYNHPLQRGKRHSSIPEIKRQLNSLGYGNISVTTLFGSYMESQIKQFQRDNNLRVNGIADERTLAALDEAISNRWVINHETYDVTFNQALDTQMNQLQQTDMYRNEPAYVHKNYVNGSNRTTANVNVRSSASSSSHIYGQIKKGTQVTILGSTGNWYRISYIAWRNPTRSDVSSYLNPDNNDIFQHLDLTSSVGVTASSLNNDILKGKGILAGRGQAFITAGKQHSVNEIYLISHALLETGNGSSALAKGIEVGINSSGNPVVVTSSNRSSLRNIRTTYNMYGIGAVDGNAHNGGAIRAYNEGWFSPEQAIIGGAEFIGNSYIHNQYNQNTLYKMRWNPANPGYPQYATDIGWAVKQVPSIKRLYDMLNNPVFKFNITQYR